MAEEDATTALLAWLTRMQGVSLDETRLREPAATAARLSALAGAADKLLPVWAEPSGFRLAQDALRRGPGTGGASA